MRRLGTILGLAFFTSVASAEFRSILRNNEGVKLFKKESYRSAYLQFLQALAENSFDPQIQFNLGVNFELLKENDKAISQYDLVLKTTDDPRLRFQSLFNKARILGTQKKVKEALALYQEALEIVPLSKETKHNIELLWQEGGGGGGEGQDKKNESGEGKQDQQQDDRKDKPQPQKPTDQQYTEQMLEELKKQEQKVRAKELDKQGEQGEANGKNW